MPNRDFFKKMVVMHKLQEREGLLAQNIGKLFPGLIGGAEQPLTDLQHEVLAANPPCFDLKVPEGLTKPMVLKIFKKIYEAMIWELYLQIKDVT